MSVDQIKRLVDVMIEGDGSTHIKTGRKCFIQNPGPTLDAFQMALTILGCSYSVRNHNGDARAVLIHNYPGNDIYRRGLSHAKRDTVHYKGRIWCPRVEDTATWVARRNGMPFITHNTFKQYSIQYVELLSRMWKSGPEGKKAAGLMLGLLILASGIQGAPGADDIDDLIDTILQSLGYRGNVKKAKRDALKALAGERMADIVMYGLSAETPIDVQSRLGLGNLFPATSLFKPSEQNKTGQIAEILGPPGGMAKSVGDFIDAAQSGQRGSAFAAMSPVFIRNIAKAAQMMDTGEYKDSRGRKVENVDAIDAIIKGIGFQPQGVASSSRKAQMLRQDIARVKEVESDIASIWAQGIHEKDKGEVDRARSMLKDWNEKNLETPIRIEYGQILRRVREMNKERSDRLEKTAPKEMRRYASDAVN